MKKYYRYCLMATIALFMIGCAGIKSVDESTLPYTVICPAADAYVPAGPGQFMLLPKGFITQSYFGSSVADLRQGILLSGTPGSAKVAEDLDPNMCPPMPGSLNHPIMGKLKIAQGFFDNPDNWLDQAEFDLWLYEYEKTSGERI
jgi:hypothetical protein